MSKSKRKYIFCISILSSVILMLFITLNQIVSMYNLEPFIFEDYRVKESFDTLTPIQFIGDYKLQDSPNYWNDWQTIFNNYSNTSSNNFAGHYKFFELPNGSFNNFALVDTNTGKIYDNTYQVLSGANYLYNPNSKLLKLSTSNKLDYYFDSSKYEGSYLDKDGFPLLDIFFLWNETSKRFDFLGEFVSNAGNYKKVEQQAI